MQASGSRPWGTCPDLVRASALETQLLGEARVLSAQSYPFGLPVDSPVRVRTHLAAEDLLLLSERHGAEHSSTVEANGGVIFFRARKAREAEVFAKQGDQVHVHTHPGLNEVMPSRDDLRATIRNQTDMVIVSRRADGGAATMRYTPVEAQELLDLLSQGDKVGFLTRIADRYQAEGLSILGTLLEENMRLQGMIP